MQLKFTHGVAQVGEGALEFTGVVGSGVTKTMRFYPYGYELPPGYSGFPLGYMTNDNYGRNLIVTKQATDISVAWGDIENGFDTIISYGSDQYPSTPPFSPINNTYGLWRPTKAISTANTRYNYLESQDQTCSIGIGYGVSQRLAICKKGYNLISGPNTADTLGGYFTANPNEINYHFKGDVLGWGFYILHVTSLLDESKSGKDYFCLMAVTKSEGYLLMGGCLLDQIVPGDTSTNLTLNLRAFLETYFVDPKLPDVPIKPDLPGSGGVEGDGGQGSGDIPSDTTPGYNPSFGFGGDSILSTGMVGAWKMNQQQLTQLVNKLWSDDAITAIKRIFSNPMDVIISLKAYPGTGIPTQDGTIKLAGFNTGVQASYYTTDGGKPLLNDTLKFTIKETWGSFLDYAPNTQIQIYLPYIGIYELDPNMVMNQTIEVTYTVDILTGECLASITNGKQFVASYSGTMGIDLPVTQRDSSEKYLAIAQSLMSIGGSAYSMGKVGSAIGPIGTAVGAGVGVAQSLPGAMGNIMEHLRPTYSMVGNCSGFAGWMSVQIPFLIITRPDIANPKDFQELNGYPSNSSGLIEEYSGFTVCQQVHLDTVTATSAEKEELERLLLSGVIL